MLTCAFKAQLNKSNIKIVYWNVCIAFRARLFWIFFKKKIYFFLKKNNFFHFEVCLGFLEKLFYKKNLF